MKTTSRRQQEASTPRWLFLTNHTLVMLTIKQHPRMSQREIAQAIGITENAVQRIVNELEAEGYLETSRVGRRKVYRIIEDMPLHHPSVGDATVGELLRLLNKRRRVKNHS